MQLDNMKSAWAQYATYLLWIGLFSFMMLSFKDFGITGDEVTQQAYGESVYNYYKTAGADTTCVHFVFNNRNNNVFYYGGFYDGLCVAIQQLTHADAFETRHAMNALFGFLAILFTALIAKRFASWEGALIATVLIALSPRFLGECMNNPKDIPFALGMTMGVYYILRLVQKMPTVKWTDFIGFIVAVALAINIRVGGLLLIPYLAVALGIQYMLVWKTSFGLFSSEMKAIAWKSILASVIAYFLGLIFWPFALQAPLSNPFIALSEMSNFSTNIRMLFDDAHIVSSQVPWYYIPKYIFISAPVVVVLAFCVFPIAFWNKTFKKEAWLFVVFACFFPVLYIIYKQAPLYDGWRHVLFVYPMLIVLATLSFISLKQWLPKPYASVVIIALVGLGMFLPLKWMMKNHPHQIVYFNELQGGVDGAFGYFETDYYMNGMKQATIKLHELTRSSKDSIIVATNCFEPLQQYVKSMHLPWKIDYVRYGQRYDKAWDYCILFSRFVDKNLLQGGYFPPKSMVASVNADETVLYAILKNDPERNAYKAAQCLAQKDFINALTYFDKSLTFDSNNETAYINAAIAAANVGDMNKAIAYIEQVLKMNPEDLDALQIAMQLYQAKGDTQTAQKYYSQAQLIIEKSQQE